MKTLIQRIIHRLALSRLFLVPLLLSCGALHAVTFTNNTAIGFGDTNYDGLDLALSNCTVNVDGPHTFSSLLVGGGGILTHSFSSSGIVSNLLDILNEADVLVGTNPVTLQESNVLNATVLVSDLTGTNFYTNNTDYLLSSTNAIWTQIQRTTNSTIPSGATVLVSYESLLGRTSAGLNLTISGSVQVLAGGMIQANGIGYTGGAGPGAGGSAGSPLAGAGGTYAGLGGPSSSGGLVSGAYGSFYTPTNLGSGGGQSYSGPGAAGGGLVNIGAGGIIIIHGSVTANGANAMNSRAGGGSGGSVWLSGAALSGSGIISANGGSGDPPHGGGGGGGRVSLVFSTSNFTGPVSAYGGAGATNGGAGTVYTQFGGSAALVLDNGGQPGATTPLAVSNSSLSVVIQGQAAAASTNAWTVENLTVSSNGTLLADSLTTLSITSPGLLMVAPGGAILANGAGYLEGQGPGAGRTWYSACGGGGYGGTGGTGLPNLAAGGAANGSQSSPSGFGSGGGYFDGTSPGGSGGGNIQFISVGGWVEVDGVVAASGLNGGGTGGGGSGGTVTIIGGSLLGSGTISANGGSGAGVQGGGGGGGRILLNPSTYQFLGTVTAYGGGGGNWGGAGTILIQGASQNPQLILDNGGNLGTNTPLLSAAGTDLTIRNGAIATSSSSGTVSLANLYINSNGWLAPLDNPQAFVPYDLSFSMSGNVTVQPGGGIVADSAGYSAGAGNGAGHSYGSGAGHGGYGGNNSGGLAVGGGTYDSTTAPSDPGSGGGNELLVSEPGSAGGAGGGVVRLSIVGTLELDGLISANGGNGSGLGGGGGGGSGGTININAATIAGSGTVRANGGAGFANMGGGGGGGCIALFPNTNLFAGSITAYGGAGANTGGAGTIYISTTGQSPQIIVDNGGQTGAETSLQSAPTADLTLRNGAVASLQSSLLPPSETFANLLIMPNAWLMPTVVLILTINGNATIASGGGIVAVPSITNGFGVGHGFAGGNNPCSGGGFGGAGAGITNGPTLGGSAYGSITAPISSGSRGGSVASSIGGFGGGNVHLSVMGTLDVSGTLSANGGNGSGPGGGGGSGGGIYLSAGIFTGTGSITANGGNGVAGQGGGGGGGRISIGYNLSSYTGAIAAYGGGGAFVGGAGTIYTKADPQAAGQVLVDNGGGEGTNTPISLGLAAPSQPFNLVVQNGGIVCPQSTATIFPQLANLTLGSNGYLVGISGPAALDLLIWSNAVIETGGFINADGLGYPLETGPGAGIFDGGYGSGAGYGGPGGASASTDGGPTYGSSLQPTNFGSGGGEGEGPLASGSAGGGAIRLNVGGALTANGQISAEGLAGVQDESGGGSGGSVWFEAGTLSGTGLVAADGGSGQLYYGGGGGGGRVALYSLVNAYAGQASARGGVGDHGGGNGTIVISNSVPALQVASTPNGFLTNEVSQVDMYFNDPPNPNTMNPGVFALVTPYGPLPSNSVSLAMVNYEHYKVTFPAQTAIGTYAVSLSTNVTDLYGRPLSATNAGSFTISLPVVQGTITDTNGHPVPGVLLQAAGLSPTSTDVNGSYALGFVPGSVFSVTPSLGSLLFLPPSTTYTRPTVSISNQNYLAVSTLAPILRASATATNLTLVWPALPGVTYQLLDSSNLVTWLPYGPPLTGTNSLQLVIPAGLNPRMFYRISASDY